MVATINSVKLVNTNESESSPFTITDNPVETGANVSDHVQRETKTLEISGFLLGATAERDYATLKDYAEKGTIVTFRGRVYFKNVLISNLSKSYNTIKNGFEITISLRDLRRASTPWVRKKKKSSGKKQPVKPKKQPVKKTTAVYVTVKSGDCYWKWWKRYGTSIAQLRKWNKWPDRRIPNGARARVK
ncbi:LysM peptidoglycan-binding domain-containing protein [Listeria monocytogenes]|uniref:LysM peptidoglycan-binding domain-containing protein n=1 Tax=Listeria monocytogenes TaxID=1639 RepID=UPI0009A4D6C4|nr:LysM domain-containing protein [Listeria monocytogenes]EDN9338777.1 LysM peptidoglycan-binding domain-containing protein [Listeria monocytogenes]EDN9471196.1 LysM peptidoglycan-binding domain-containing protein [Listeria monocytogenes]EII2583848.1 LysM peptidoglycan-binding domain-containing protein [Listeria monocytogenes]HAB6509336.1 LysM peptidoglycan-binding domain-containing protein [Listeria monocytogenes]HAM1112468.1 LysM peptidoglycan-binding domain-containing protein [Listeria mono